MINHTVMQSIFRNVHIFEHFDSITSNFQRTKYSAAIEKLWLDDPPLGWLLIGC